MAAGVGPAAVMMLTVRFEPALGPGRSRIPRAISLLMFRAILRAQPVFICAALTLALLPACSARKPAARFSQKLVILDSMDGPRARRALDQGRPASEYGEAGVARWPSSADDDTLSGVADGVGIVCDGCEPWQAQHLRFSRPRHEYLPARSRNGPAGAAEVSAQLFSDRQTSRAVHSRRHLVLGDGRPGRRAVEYHHRPGRLFLPRMCPTASCSPDFPCPTSGARWAPSTTSRLI